MRAKSVVEGKTTVTLVVKGVEIELTLKEAKALHEKLGEVVDRSVQVWIREVAHLPYPRYPWVSYATTTDSPEWKVQQSPEQGITNYKIVC